MTRPRSAGVLALDAATRDQPLEVFIGFASTTGVLGNVGQTDYAAANAFLDVHAVHRARAVQAGERSGRTLSIAWPLWAEGGMQVDAATRERVWRSGGLVSLSTSAGLVALKHAL